jgi:hypothetical protein
MWPIFHIKEIILQCNAISRGFSRSPHECRYMIIMQAATVCFQMFPYPQLMIMSLLIIHIISVVECEAVNNRRPIIVVAGFKA